MATRPTGHAHAGGGDAAAELEDVIALELAAQAAEALGLDADADYQAELHRLSAQAQAFRRRHLSALYYERALADARELDDAEVRAYFDAHRDAIQQRIQVRQILLRDRSEIDEVVGALGAGDPFDQVAARRFPDLPANVPPPWEVKDLHWNQIPDPWRDAVSTLAPGQISEVIPGPRGRYWIVQLVGRTDDPSITFEVARPTIVTMLRHARESEARAAAERELVEAATVVKTPQRTARR